MVMANQKGPGHGRARNTFRDRLAQARNDARKTAGGRADPFPLGPMDQVDFGIQARDLKLQHSIAMARLAQQGSTVRQQYKTLRRGSIEAGRAGLSDVAGEMSDRGIVGSTAHLAGEQDVKGATQQEIAEARMARDQGLGDIALSRLEAVGQLRLGLGDIALRRAAMQREMALAAYGSGGANPWGY